MLRSATDRRGWLLPKASAARKRMGFVVSMCLASLFVSAPVSAFADQWSRLTKSKLLRQIEARGDWAVQIEADAIRYSCVTCAGHVEARLEIVSPYDGGLHGSAHQRYLAERRQQCVDLVASRTGRCAALREIGWGMSLTGFAAEHETVLEKVTEISLFSREWGVGPQLIKATVRVETTKAQERYDLGFLTAHMARLTLFY